MINSVGSFNSLSPEILEELFLQLDWKSARSLALVNRLANEVFCSDYIVFQNELVSRHFSCAVSPDCQQHLRLSIERARQSSPIRIGKFNEEPLSSQFLRLDIEGKRGLSINGKTLTLRDLDTEDSPLLCELESEADLKISEMNTQGTKALSGSADGNVILWDLIEKKPIHNLLGHKTEITCLVLSADCKRALSSCTKMIKFWDLTTGGCLLALAQKSVHRLKMNADCTRAISGSWDFNDDDNIEPDNNKFKLWDLENSICLGTFDIHANMLTCQWHINTNWTVALSGTWDEPLKLWDPMSGELIHIFDADQPGITCFSMNAEGTRAISAIEDDYRIIFWNLTTKECIHSLVGHIGRIEFLTLSADCTRAMSGSEDQTIKLWDLIEGRCIFSYDHGHEITSLTISADEIRALSKSQDGCVNIWNLVPFAEEMQKAREAQELAIALAVEARELGDLSDDWGLTIFDDMEDSINENSFLLSDDPKIQEGP